MDQKEEYYDFEMRRDSVQHDLANCLANGGAEPRIAKLTRLLVAWNEILDSHPGNPTNAARGDG